ncbi:EpsG family protein [Wohlfahrtiimonas chitiniclastica]|uniref:EpsG family protein n=1 Tax=Wohlfahrtiimonas chitiniclastica TaxID=400946 RepID=UPI001BCBD674|nr:EpsG family protein [Wohlfahrtiimonas chitiniclastica]MBS7836630.1 EpsG family protein [Wohlfahrtiimonas chitiniclastica]
MIQTYLIYNLMLLGSTGLLYVREKIVQPEQVKLKLILLLAAFLIVTIPSAIRFEIGTDYYGYIMIFNNIDAISHIELGFTYLTKFIRIFTDNPQWGIAVYAFLFSVLIFLSYPKEDAYLFNMITLSILLLPSFNIIRQVLAISLTLIACHQYYNKKIITSGTLMFCAGLFHSSEFLLLGLFLITLIPLSDQWKSYILPRLGIIIIVLLYFFVDQVIIVLSEISVYFFPKYQHLIDSKTVFIKVNWGMGLGVTAKVLFSIYVLANAKYLLEKHTQNWLIILMIFSYGIATILAGYIAIFDRFMYIFSAAPIFAAYELFRKSQVKSLMRLTACLFILVLLLSFEKMIYAQPSDYGDSKLLPYRTIFLKVSV